MDSQPEVRSRVTCVGFFVVLLVILAGMAALMLVPFGWLLYTECKGPYHNTTSVADLDNDGDQDLVITNLRYETESAIWHQITLWINQGDGRFTPLYLDTPPFGYLSAAAGDLDGDIYPDLALLRSDRLEILRNQDDGLVEFSLTDNTSPHNQVGTPGSVILGDLDKDGKLDAFVAGCCSMVFPPHENNQGLYIPSQSWRWINDGESELIKALDDVRVREAALGDLDGDSDLDVYAAALKPRMEGQGEAGDRVLLNDGTGSLTDTGQRLGDSDSTAVALGDLDGDGDLDALVGKARGAQVWTNQGNQGARFFYPGQKIGDDPLVSVFLADLDGDGDMDAILGARHRLTVWWNDGSGEFSPSSQRFPISERSALAVGDFNGDGSPDIFAGVYAEGYKLWLNRGNGEFYRKWEIPMRKLLVFTNTSLDGYFEGADHDLTAFKNDFEAFPSQPGAEVDALLLGHKTYEMMKFWSTPQAAEMMPAVASFMNDTQKYVASHRAFKAGWKNVTVITGDVEGKLRTLKAGSGKNILILGSNALVVSLLQVGLIDELQIVVNPVALGKGTAIFKGLPGKADFSLAGTRVFNSGAVMLRLEPVP